MATVAAGRTRTFGPGAGPRLMVLPMVVGLLAFAVYPVLYLTALSFSKSLLGKPFQAWVGLANYGKAAHDQTFLWSLARSAAFALPVTLAELVAGVTVALLLQSSLRRGHVVRTLLLLPLMTPPIMVAVAWRLILSPVGGLLNTILTRTGLADQPVSVLGSATWAMPAIGLADAWQWTPFVVLLTYAALQTQSEEVRHAALVDGASEWRAFWSVTLPLLLPALAAIGLLRMIGAFKLFDLVYALTQGGPGFSTTVGSYLIYRTGFEKFDVGYAAALTMLFGLFVGVVTLPVVLLRDRVLRQFG